MAHRSQGLKVGIGRKRQSTLGAMLASGDLWNLQIGDYRTPVPELGRTTDAPFFGKGHPHATRSIKLGANAPFEMSTPHLSSQNWAQAVVFGCMDFDETPNGSGAFQYTGTLLTETGAVDAIATTIVGQLDGGNGMDSALLDMVLQSMTLTVTRSAELNNASLTMRWVGSGRWDPDSDLVIPSAYAETRLSMGMLSVFSIGGVNYLSPDRFFSFEFMLENETARNSDYGPQANQSGFDVRSRMRVVNQTPRLVWMSEVDDTSEFDDFVNGVQGETIIQLTGPAIGGGASHMARIRFPNALHTSYVPEDADGFAGQRITTEPLMDASEGVCILTAVTDQTGIGSEA